MATITKLVNRSIAPLERVQSFTQADASTGDILDLDASLGGPAASVRIIASDDSDLSVQRNTEQELYPLRSVDEGFGTALDPGYIQTADKREYSDTTQGTEPIGNESTAVDLTLSGPIRTLKVTWTAGTWTVVASM